MLKPENQQLIEYIEKELEILSKECKNLLEQINKLVENSFPDDTLWESICECLSSSRYSMVDAGQTIKFLNNSLLLSRLRKDRSNLLVTISKKQQEIIELLK
jgi:hypothetical protein